MLNIQIIDQLSKLKDKKISILQLGFQDYILSEWITKNIMNHPKSELFFLNIEYQYHQNDSMIDRNKIKIRKNIFKTSKHFIDIQKTSNQMLLSFREEKRKFDLILIDLQFMKNRLSYIIQSWDLLKDDGILLLINPDFNQSNDKVVETFLNIYGKNMDIYKSKEMTMIGKKLNVGDVLNFPIYIEKILNQYLSSKTLEMEKRLKTGKMKKIDWNFEINNQYIKGEYNYGYHYEIEKYEKYIYDIQNSFFDKIKNLDLNYFLIYRRDDLRKLNMNIYKTNTLENRIDKIKKIFDLNLYFKQSRFFKESDLLHSDKKINIFCLSSLLKSTDVYEYVHETNKKIEMVFLTSQKVSKKKNPVPMFVNKDLFDFENMEEIINKIKKQFGIIFINVCRYINKNGFGNSYHLYSNLLLLNILYLILNIQEKGGELYFVIPPMTHHVQIQILQILTNVYEKVEIKTYFSYSNYYGITIFGKNFKGISKEELDRFRDVYFHFYERDIKPHKNDIFLGKRVEGLYLQGIYTNPVNHVLIKNIRDFNRKYYQQFIDLLKMKVDIYDFLSNKTTTKKQKEYIMDKILQHQYNTFIEESKKLGYTL